MTQEDLQIRATCTKKSKIYCHCKLRKLNLLNERNRKYLYTEMSEKNVSQRFSLKFWKLVYIRNVSVDPSYTMIYKLSFN